MTKFVSSSFFSRVESFKLTQPNDGNGKSQEVVEGDAWKSAQKVETVANFVLFSRFTTFTTTTLQKTKQNRAIPAKLN